MGFLNILGYIGVGLAAALILLLISYLWSRPKETVLYEDGSTSKGRGDGNWTLASWFPIFTFCIISTLLLINLAHFSILKSIGLGLLSDIAIVVLLSSVMNILYKNIKRMTENSTFLFLTIIFCTLNGAGFAILASVWGWF